MAHLAAKAKTLLNEAPDRGGAFRGRRATTMEGIITQPGDGTGGYEMTMRAKKAAVAVPIRVERALWRELKKT